MNKQSSRKIGNKGGIIIPKEIRGNLRLEGKYMRISTNDQGQIILTPFSIECTFCEATEAVAVLKGKGICSSCLSALKTQHN